MRQRTNNTEETQRLAENFLASLSPRASGATVVGLSGELGAGKTTFMQGLGRALGVSRPLQSPTFVIQKTYNVAHPHFDRLVHIDAYRLESADELARLGFADCVASDRSIVCIEWPERVAALLPDDAVTVSFAHAGDDVRDITLPDDKTHA